MSDSIQNIVVKKDLEVETLRGIATILIVFYHAGLFFSNSDLIKFIFYLSDGIRMPLFTAISGYVYAARPVKDSVFQFITKKSQRLLIPFYSIMTLSLILNFNFDNLLISFSDWSIRGIAKYYIVEPFSYWFLYAVFIIFIIVSALDYFKRLERLNSVIILMALSFIVGALVNYFDPRIFNVKIYHLFSINGAMYLLPYFLLGLLIFRFGELRDNRKLFTYIIILFLGLMFLHLFQYDGNMMTKIEKRTDVKIFLIGITGVFLIFYFRFKSNFLAKIGQYSFSIFILHLFCFEISKNFNISIGKLDLSLFIIILSGIVLPIVFHRIFYLSHIAKFLFYGKLIKD